MRLGIFPVRAAAWLGAIFAADVLLSPLGLCVGLNLFTAVFCAVLGVPGFLMLYALAYIL